MHCSMPVSYTHLDVYKRQEQLNRTLADMLADPRQRAFWGRNGLAYADSADLYSMPKKAADVILAERRA